MGRQTRVLAAAGVVGLLLVAATGAGAVGPGSPRVPPAPVGSDFWISGPDAVGTGSAELAVAWNATANEYLVVWSDQRDAATQGSNIYGRRVGADGTPLGEDIRVTGAAVATSRAQPAVVWNATFDEYLVVWSDWRSIGGGHGANIWGRRVDADGSLIGRNPRMSSGPQDEVDPSVAWNAAANEYLAVWEDDRHAEWQGAPPPADG